MKKLGLSVERRRAFIEIPKKESTHTGFNVGPWSVEEHNTFLKAIKTYGNSWKKVQLLVKTRTCSQIRVHFTRYLRKLRVILRQKFLANSDSGITDIDILKQHLVPLGLEESSPETNFMEEKGQKELAGEKADNSKVIEQLVNEELENIRASEAKDDSFYHAQNDLIIPLESYCLQECLKGNLKLC